MLKFCIPAALALFGAVACAHHGAKRAQCDGPLRPINPPDTTAPVTVEPAAPQPHDEGRQP